MARLATRLAKIVISFGLLMGGAAVAYVAGAGAGSASEGQYTTTLPENFEQGSLRSFGSSSNPGTAPGWSVVTTAAHSPTHSAFAPDIETAATQDLTLLNGFAVPSSGAGRLTLWHRFSFEANTLNCYDAGVLETSIDNGASWQDAGTNITLGGYTETVRSGSGNPLAGRPAWCRTSPSYATPGAFDQVTLNLVPYAGQMLKIRFREGTDSSVAATGWWVDDVSTAGPTVVEVLRGSAVRSKRLVTVRWRTGSEQGILGFNVYGGVESKRTRRNKTTIAPHGSTPAGHRYSFSEPVAGRRVFGPYWVQILHLRGKPTWFGPIAVG